MPHAIILFLLLVFSALTNAQANELVITKRGESFKQFTVGMYEDSSKQLSFDQIRLKNDFKPVSNHLSEGYSASTFWVKFKISNKSTSTVKYYIKFTENSMHEVNFYSVSTDGSYHLEKRGISHLDNSTPLHPVEFQLNLNQGESKTIYISTNTVFPTAWAFYVLDKQSLNDYIATYNTIYAFFFGILFALIFYNSIIFSYSKDKSYLKYVIYASLFFSWQIIINGLLPKNIIHTPELYYFTIGVLIPLIIATFVSFSRSLLETKALLPQIDNILKLICHLFLLLSVSSLFYYQTTFIITTALVPMLMPFLIYTAVKCLKKGSKTAIFYIIAQVTFISLTSIYSLMSEGLLPYNLFNRHGIMIGAIIEITLFSLALAYKIKSLQSEKLLIINHQNTKLEQMVAERTDELKELAHRDPLTNLHNRRFLYEISENLIQFAKREKTPLSLIMFDLDNFKRINDTYGHTLGDEVIKIFAQKIQNTRESDISARVGGEEFVLLLPNTSDHGAYEIANQIRIEIEKTTVTTEENAALHFTVSAGVSLLSAGDNNIEQLLDRADKALYMAKESGKNKIIRLDA